MSTPSSRFSSGIASGQRATILEATLRVLSESGPGGLKVRAVADAAGCSTMGVYTWFGNKDGLIEAVWLDSFRRFGDALEQVEWHVGDRSLDGLMAGLIVYRGWAVANRERYRTMFAHAFPDFRPSEAAETEALATFQILVDAVARCQAEGSLAPGNTAVVANHIWASIHGYVMLELTLGGGTSQGGEAVYRHGLDLIFSGLAATAFRSD